MTEANAGPPGAPGTPAGEPGAPGTPTVEELQKQLDEKKAEAQRHAKRAERITELEKKVGELEGRLTPPKEKPKDGEEPPTVPPKSGDPEVARLNREIRELREERDKDKKELATEKEERQKATHRSVARGFVSRAKLEAPDDAVELLLGRTKLAKDGQTLIFTAKNNDGESEEVELTDETFEKSKLLPPPFWPPKGGPGGGGKAPKELGGGVVDGVDLDRARRDPVYYAANRDKVIAARRKQEAT